MNQDEVVRCSISYNESTPYLLIEFNPDIHKDNISEIVEAIKYTVMQKLNCMIYMAEVNKHGYS